MPKVIGSCGHQIKNKFNTVKVKDRSRGTKIVRQMLLCDRCEQDYKNIGLILENQEQMSEWLNLGDLPLLS